jgi:hypothetical protein
MDESITVAIGSPDDLKSHVWRFWIQNNEVYLTARSARPPLKPLAKISFHKSGDCHAKIGRTKVLQWRKPKPDRFGITQAFVVIVDPFPVTTPFKNKTINDPDIRWIPVAPYGKAVALIVMFATRQSDLDSSRFPTGTRPLAKFKKFNGEAALFVSHDWDLTPRMREVIIGKRSEIKIHVRETSLSELHLADSTRPIAFYPPGSSGEMNSAIDLTLGWENVVSDLASG